MTIMQALLGGGGVSSFAFNATISANTANYNLRAAAVAAGWDQIKPLNATVTINSGVYVYSTSTGTYAFDTGVTFPTGTTLSLVNNGTILGMGGAGAGAMGMGPGGTFYYTPINTSFAAAGGPGLIARYALSVTNNGIIAGGGGGGGGGFSNLVNR